MCKPKDSIEENGEIDLRKIVSQGLSEYEKGETKKLNFSKSLHDQLIED